MKKFFIACTCIASAICANAQMVGEVDYFSNFDTDYNRITVGYDATMFSGKWSGAYYLGDGNHYLDDGMTLNGFNVQYVHGFKLMQYNPLFLELGGKLSTNFHSEKIKKSSYDITATTTKMSLAVPVSLTYRFGLGGNCALSPYTGINFKANLLGNWKVKAEDRYDSDSSSQSCFDKDEQDDAAWKRFQMGWQIGLGFNFQKIYLGVEYGIDFLKLYKNCNTSTLSVNLGYEF